jgi:peptide/nickel transport system substrate-binding protein
VTNFAHYSAVDEMIDSARNESATARQEALWRAAQASALSAMVAYPIQYTSQVYARAANVDYGHELKSVIQLYPGVDERTRLIP